MGDYVVTLSGDFVTISVSCYIIGKFGVTLSVDVTLLGVVTLTGVTGSSPAAGDPNGPWPELVKLNVTCRFYVPNICRDEQGVEVWGVC